MRSTPPEENASQEKIYAEQLCQTFLNEVGYRQIKDAMRSLLKIQEINEKNPEIVKDAFERLFAKSGNPNNQKTEVLHTLFDYKQDQDAIIWVMDMFRTDSWKPEEIEEERTVLDLTYNIATPFHWAVEAHLDKADQEKKVDEAHMEKVFKHLQSLQPPNGNKDIQLFEDYLTLANPPREFIQTLLKFGVDPNRHNGENTPLILAIKDGNPLIVCDLLDAGANPNGTIPKVSELPLNTILNYNSGDPFNQACIAVLLMLHGAKADETGLTEEAKELMKRLYTVANETRAAVFKNSTGVAPILERQITGRLPDRSRSLKDPERLIQYIQEALQQNGISPTPNLD